MMLPLDVLDVELSRWLYPYEEGRRIDRDHCSHPCKNNFASCAICSRIQEVAVQNCTIVTLITEHDLAGSEVGHKHPTARLKPLAGCYDVGEARKMGTA
jgi:hypothetical protein